MAKPSFWPWSSWPVERGWWLSGPASWQGSPAAFPDPPSFFTFYYSPFFSSLKNSCFLPFIIQRISYSRTSFPQQLSLSITCRLFFLHWQFSKTRLDFMTLPSENLLNSVLWIQQQLSPTPCVSSSPVCLGRLPTTGATISYPQTIFYFIPSDYSVLQIWIVK